MSKEKRRRINSSYLLLTLLLVFSLSTAWAQQQAVFVNPPVSGNRYQDVSFNVGLIAVNASGFALNGSYFVDWESSLGPDPAPVPIQFTNGVAVLPITLTNTGAQTIVISVDLDPAVDPTTSFSVTVVENNADFAIVGFSVSGNPVTEITAGQDFDIQLTDVLGIGGVALTPGDYTVKVTTNQASLVDGLVEVFNGSVTFTDNSGTTEATISITDENVNKASNHIFTIEIVELWHSELSAVLTVNEGSFDQLIIEQQPLLVEGDFTGIPAVIDSPPFRVITADKYKNQTLDYFGENLIDDKTLSITVLDISNTFNLTNNSVSLEYPGFALFSNLDIDAEGEDIILTFIDDLENKIVDSEPFDVININDLSEFEVVNPGPRVVSSTFDLYIRNARGNNGQLLNEQRTVTVEQQDVPGSVVFTPTFVNGEAKLTGLTAQASAATYFIDVTVSGVVGEAVRVTHQVIAQPTPDPSGFTLQIRPSPSSAAISGTVNIVQGAPFSVLVNGATDIQGNTINTSQLVTITDATDGPIYTGWLDFTSGNAETPPELVLPTTGVRDLTVVVYWVTDSETIGVNVFVPEITIRQGSTDLNTTSSRLDLGSLTFGYDSNAATGAAETVTVARVGLSDVQIDGVSITNTTVFEIVNAPSWPQTLDGTDPYRTFDIKPKTGVNPGIYSSLVSVTYTFGSITGSQSFGVDFEVLDSYEISLYNVTDATADFTLPIDFGSVEGIYTQPVSKTIRIDNEGTGAITNLSVSLGGAQPFGFEIINLGATSIAFGGNTTFDVRPKTDLGVGTYTATVDITANNGIIESFDVEFEVVFSFSVDDDTFLGTFSDNYADFLSVDSVWFEFTVKNTNPGFVNPLNTSTLISLSATADFELVAGRNTELSGGTNLVLSQNVFPGDSATYFVKPKTDLVDGNYRTVTVQVDPNGTPTTPDTEIVVDFYVADVQWTGASNSAWDNAANWTYSPFNGNPPITVPNSYVNVIIPNVLLPNDDPTISDDIVANDLTIQSGAILTLSASTLTVNEALNVSGELSVPSGTVLETAAGSVTNVTGSLNLGSGGNINNAGTFTLDNSVSLGGTFTNAGTLTNLATRTLTVSSGATLANNTGGIFTQGGVVTLSGTFTNAATVNNAGNFTHNGTAFTNQTGGTFNNNATGVFTVNASRLLLNQGTFANADNSQLTVNPLGRITSESGATLSNSETNINNFVVESNGLGSTGSVIINNAGTYASVQRWLAASPSGADQRYQMISSPVIGQNIAAFLTAHIGLIANNGAMFAMRKYMESLSDWSALFTTGGGSNISGINGSSDFVPGAAYTTRLWATPGAVTFKGELASETLPVTLVKTHLGWNGLGNPFPSSINAADFLTDYGGQLQADRMGLWIWNGATKAYDIINAIPATPDQEYIALGQGFIVKAAANNNEVQLQGGYREHQSPNFRKNATNREDWVILKLHVEDGNNNSSNTLLAFHNEMTEGLDVGYDAGLFYEVNDNLLIYSVMPEGISPDLRLLRQALYKENIHSLMIPIGLVNTDGGNVEFTLESLYVPNGWIPVLYDAQKNVYTDLSVSTYIAAITPGEPVEGRFFLNLQNDSDEYSVVFQPLATTRSLANGDIRSQKQDENGYVTALMDGKYLESGVKVPRSSDLLFQAFATPGYNFSHWVVNGEIIADYDHTFYALENITGNVVVEAAFANKDGKFDPLSTMDYLLEELQIYPSSSAIIISGKVGENTQASLYDMLGRLVDNETLIPGDYNKIDATGLQAGTYLLRINNHTGGVSVKLQIP